MQVGMVLGFATAYPVNRWLIRRGIREVPGCGQCLTAPPDAAYRRCAGRPRLRTSSLMHRHVTQMVSLAMAAMLCIAAVALASPAARPGRSQVSTSSVQPRLKLQPTVVPLAGRLTFIGRGFRPNEKVWLGVGPPQSEARFWGSARASTAGSFRRTLAVKPRVGPGRWVTGPGRWVALACQRSCRIKAGATFRIVRGLG